LPLRSATGAVPMLLAARHDSDPKVRTAAAAALGDLGSMAEQGALIEWVQGATDEGEQSRAIRSLVEVTLRNPAVETRGAAVFAALEKSQPELALRWLPVLQRIGGTASAGCAARLAVRESPELATAATATLARWSDHTALASLATVTEKAASPEVRRAALDGALRYFERNREPWTPATTRLISRLLASATDIEARSSLVALLNRANDRGAIAVARKAAADPALAAKAGAAIEVIRANLAGPPVVRASGNQENVANIIDGKPNTRWNVAAREGEWLEIEFKRSRPLSRLTLEQGGRDGEFPERYEVFVSDDRRNPGPVRATGGGQQQRTVISLPEGTRGRIVMIRNTAGRSSPQWSVFELHVD
ncbi:MAG: discoidin domain-containing protein, partial [Opitutus sp.]